MNESMVFCGANYAIVIGNYLEAANKNREIYLFIIIIFYPFAYVSQHVEYKLTDLNIFFNTALNFLIMGFGIFKI